MSNILFNFNRHISLLHPKFQQCIKWIAQSPVFVLDIWQLIFIVALHMKLANLSNTHAKSVTKHNVNWNLNIFISWHENCIPTFNVLLFYMVLKWFGKQELLRKHECCGTYTTMSDTIYIFRFCNSSSQFVFMVWGYLIEIVLLLAEPVINSRYMQHVAS